MWKIEGDVAGRIKEVRTGYQLDQEDFAKWLHCPEIYVEDLESGKAVPTKMDLIEISRTYHCQYLWLLTGEGQKHRDSMSEKINDLMKKMDDTSVLTVTIIKGSIAHWYIEQNSMIVPLFTAEKLANLREAMNTRNNEPPILVNPGE